jgi:plastocyanin
MNLRRAAAGALALSTVIALGACTKQDNGNNTLVDAKPGPSKTTSAPAPAPGGPLAIEAKDNEFVPKALTASAGDVTITMKNTGAAPHTFTLADPKADVNADAGKTVEIKLTGLKAGTYKFVCKYHEALGMTGELTVT